MIQVNHKGVFEDIYSLDELAEHTIETIKQNIGHHSYSADSSQGNQLLGFFWYIRSFHNISNHSYAPVGHSTNPGGRDLNMPTGFPGWYGKMTLRFRHKVWLWGSNMMNNTLIHTSTSDRTIKRFPDKTKNKKDENYEIEFYNWKINFFNSDFPNLDMEQAFAKLKGETITAHAYDWGNIRNMIARLSTAQTQSA